MKHLTDYRIVVDLTGHHVFKAETLEPNIVLNIPEPEKASCLKTLQGLSSEEFTTLKSNLSGLQKEESVLGEAALAVDSAKVNLEEINFTVLKQATLYCALIEDLIEKYDIEKALIVAYAATESDLAFLVEKFQAIEKAGFILSFLPTGEVPQLVATIAKAMEWTANIEGGVVSVSNKKTTSENIWKGGVTPQFKPKGKVELSKAMDFGGFESLEDFMKELCDVTQKQVAEGCWGYSIEEHHGEVKEAPYYFPVRILVDFIIFRVGFWDQPMRLYKVAYTCEEKKIVVSMPGELVEEVTVYVLPTEAVEVSPASPPPNATTAPKTASVENKASSMKIERMIMKQDSSNKAEEGRMVYGVVLEPNDGADGAPKNPDSQGDIYSAEEIEQAAHLWLSDYLVNGIQHEQIAGRKIQPIESFIAPADYKIGEQTILKGSWVLVAKLSEDLWKEVKAGNLNSWSIGGFALRTEEA